MPRTLVLSNPNGRGLLSLVEPNLYWGKRLDRISATALTECHPVWHTM